MRSRVLRREFPSFVAGICQAEGLRPLSATGVARLAEHAVRKAGRKGKITAQSWLIADVLREADYWAGERNRRAIRAADVDQAVDEAIDRVNLVEKKIAEMIADVSLSVKISRVNARSILILSNEGGGIESGGGRFSGNLWFRYFCFKRGKRYVENYTLKKE